MGKVIKISDDNYKWLSEKAGELQKKRGKPVSLDEALQSLRTKPKLSDLAGSWKMTDEEAKQLKKELREMWGTWKLKSW